MIRPVVCAALLVLAQAPPDTGVVLLREILVTGSRLPESILRTPAALSVVDKASYDDTRGISLADALGAEPGVVVQSRSGAQDVRVTIRGFGARGNGERSNSGGVRGIRVLADGVPLTEPDGRTGLDLVDLGSTHRIEVLRSNASVLYGNASGGVIHLRTDLDFESPYLQLRERAGSFGYHKEQILGGFRLGETGRGVASLQNYDFDGWREHSESTAFQTMVRLKGRLGGETALGVSLDAVSDLNLFPGPLTAAEADSAPEQANADFAARNERRRNRIGRMALTLDRGAGSDQELALSFYIEPKVLERSERNRFRDFTRYHVGGSASYAWHAPLASDLRSTLTVGADEAWQDGTVLFYDLVPYGARGDELLANQREGANTAGVFVQEEVVWKERWSARLAARYDNIWYVAEDRMEPALDDEMTFSRVTPKASLAYETDRFIVFAALGGGVESPAFNEVDPPAPYDTLTTLNPFLDPMRSTTYELGARGETNTRLADRDLGRLRYDLALYWIDVHDEIVPFDGGAYYYTAGRSRRQGFECGLDWLYANRLAVGAAFTWSRNRYVIYENDRGNFADNEVPGLPAVVLRLTGRYQTPFGLSAELVLDHVDDYFADDANTAATEPYTLLGARASYAHDVGAVSLGGFVGVENLTGAHYTASVFLNGVDGEYYEPGLPRNWSFGLTAGWK